MFSEHYFFGNAFPRVKIPPEFSSADQLMTALGLTTKEIAYISSYKTSMYTSFSIPSGNKTRFINAPNGRLKYLQSKISEFLGAMYTPRKSTHGYVKKKSIVTNAWVHAAKRYVINLDLQDFFPSITRNRVLGLLRSLGISSEVSEIICNICCYNENLPQGAPSSPVLSNMICFSLDRALHHFCRVHKLIYTRYADDITISTNGSPLAIFAIGLPKSGKLALSDLSEDLVREISVSGFLLNPEKIRFSAGSDKKIVTGLIVNEFPNVSRKYIRNIRATLHNIEKDGFSIAQQAYRDRVGNQAKSLLQHVRGEISHIGNVKGKGDPVYRTLADRFNLIFDDKLKTELTPKERIHGSIWVVKWKLTDKKTEELYKLAELENKSIHDVIEEVQGTAFFLDGFGLVTAAHCAPTLANDLEYFHIWHPLRPNIRHEVSVQKICVHRDICLLDHSVPAPEFSELKVFRNAPRGEDKARAYGFTDYKIGDPATTSNGEISHISRKSAVKYLNLSFKVGQGMSGGPVLDEKSRLIGIIHKGGPGELRDYAVHAEELVRFSMEQ